MDGTTRYRQKNQTEKDRSCQSVHKNPRKTEPQTRANRQLWLSKLGPHERRLQEWPGRLEASADDPDHVRVFFAFGQVFLSDGHIQPEGSPPDEVLKSDNERELGQQCEHRAFQ